MTKKLLYFSCYRPLGEARSLILQQAGYSVISSVEPDEVARLCSENGIDLVIVCNGCDDNAMARLTGLLHHAALPVPVLSLDARHAEAWRDPEMLVLLIRGILRQKEIPGMIAKRPVAKEEVPNLTVRSNLSTY